MENLSFWGSGRPLGSRPAPQNDRFSIKSLNPHLLNPHRAAADLKARWTEDSKNRNLKFSFLKEWVASDGCSWLTECSLSIFVWLHFWGLAGAGGRESLQKGRGVSHPTILKAFPCPGQTLKTYPQKHARLLSSTQCRSPTRRSLRWYWLKSAWSPKANRPTWIVYANRWACVSGCSWTFDRPNTGPPSHSGWGSLVARIGPALRSARKSDKENDADRTPLILTPAQLGINI